MFTRFNRTFLLLMRFQWLLTKSNSPTDGLIQSTAPTVNKKPLVDLKLNVPEWAMKAPKLPKYA
ncbi:hypothetical protein C1N72_04985 [Pantoea ananatis]